MEDVGEALQRICQPVTNKSKWQLVSHCSFSIHEVSNSWLEQYSRAQLTDTLPSTFSQVPPITIILFTMQTYHANQDMHLIYSADIPQVFTGPAHSTPHQFHNLAIKTSGKLVSSSQDEEYVPVPHLITHHPGPPHHSITHQCHHLHCHHSHSMAIPANIFLSAGCSVVIVYHSDFVMHEVPSHCTGLSFPNTVDLGDKVDR